MLRDGLIVVLAGLVAFVLLHDWVRTRFGPTPEELTAAKRARVVEPSPIAVHAVHQYLRLSVEERNELAASLDAALIPVSAWVEQLGEKTFEVICLGEDHESSTREFLAREFFAKVFVDVLLLEATVDGLERIEAAVASGDARVPLLEADIAEILRALAPGTRHRGGGHRGDGTPARCPPGSGAGPAFATNPSPANFWERFRPGRRHVVLIGALHCNDERNWMFARLRREAPPRTVAEMLSVRILGQHQYQTVSDFVHFLDRIGFPRRSFVIGDPQHLHPRLDEWFRLLAYTMRRYRVVIVFRE